MELLIKDLYSYQKIAQALSIDARIRIFELLQTRSLNINEIAEELNFPVPTVTVNVKKMEEADLIISEQKPGIRGSQKVCTAKYSRIVLALDDSSAEYSPAKTLETDMPIGNYVACKVDPTCGMLSDTKVIGKNDDIQTFYSPDKINAQLIWLTNGYLEYHFPNNIPDETVIESIRFSAELCSEVRYYKNHSPSDITLWINDVEVGTWTSPGDFGGKRGKLTPHWWGIHKTQYGLLKQWSVTNEGSYIDDDQTSDLTIDDLHLHQQPFISIRIGIKDGGKKTGFNLFGRGFGNYPQDLHLEITYH